MTRYFKESEHGSITAFVQSKPDTGGVSVDAAIEGEFNPNTDTWLEDIRVLPEGQGRGEADSLLDGLEQEARAKGCRRIIGCFEPWADLEAAARFYMKHNYKLKKSKRNTDTAFVYKDLT